MSHLDQRDLELFMYAYELLGHRRLESEDEPVTRLPTRVPVRLFSARIFDNLCCETRIYRSSDILHF